MLAKKITKIILKQTQPLLLCTSTARGTPGLAVSELKVNQLSSKPAMEL